MLVRSSFHFNRYDSSGIDLSRQDLVQFCRCFLGDVPWSPHPPLYVPDFFGTRAHALVETDAFGHRDESRWLK